MEFVLERYNYWIIIILMMGGLYIVFESQNLIKRLVGLSIFQTSVIVFYVTLGKVAGGTAPIYLPDDPRMAHHGGGHEVHGEEHAGGDHGDNHGEAYSDDASHAEPAHAENEHATDDAHAPEEGESVLTDADAHAEDVTEDLHEHDVAESGSDDALHAAEATDHADADHAEPTHDTHAKADAGLIQPITHDAHDDDSHHAEAHSADAFVYSNPLPHVLMLTAIVVGVATLSVGLALVVRTREAYGTIEMDEITQADIATGEREGEAA